MNNETTRSSLEAFIRTSSSSGDDHGDDDDDDDHDHGDDHGDADDAEYNFIRMSSFSGYNHEAECVFISVFTKNDQLFQLHDGRKNWLRRFTFWFLVLNLCLKCVFLPDLSMTEQRRRMQKRTRSKTCQKKALFFSLAGL